MTTQSQSAFLDAFESYFDHPGKSDQELRLAAKDVEGDKSHIDNPYCSSKLANLSGKSVRFLDLTFDRAAELTLALLDDE